MNDQINQLFVDNYTEFCEKISEVGGSPSSLAKVSVKEFIQAISKNGLSLQLKPVSKNSEVPQGVLKR